MTCFVKPMDSSNNDNKSARLLVKAIITQNATASKILRSLHDAVHVLMAFIPS